MVNSTLKDLLKHYCQIFSATAITDMNMYFLPTAVIEGELWTECGDTYLTDDIGSISSPLYPKPYPDNVRCQWLIESQEEQSIALRYFWWRRLQRNGSQIRKK